MGLVTPSLMYEKGSDEISCVGLPGIPLFFPGTESIVCVSPGHLFSGQTGSDVEVEGQDFLCSRKLLWKSAPGA